MGNDLKTPQGNLIIAFVLFADQPIIFKKELGGALVKKVLWEKREILTFLQEKITKPVT